MSYSFTIEAVSNCEGILASPIRIDNQTISELGMYTIKIGTQNEVKLWVVPQENSANFESPKKPDAWFIRVRNGRSFFAGFESDGDDFVVATWQKNIGRIYYDQRQIETVIKFLEILHPELQLVTMECCDIEESK